MITQQESQLTAGQYSDLFNATGDVAARVILQRLGPVWSDIGHTQATDDDQLVAHEFGGNIFRAFLDNGAVTVEYLADESVSTQDWISVGTHSDIDVDDMFDLAADDSTIRLFYRTSSGMIACSDCTDPVTGFGSPTMVTGESSDILMMAAPDVNSIHFVTLTALSNRRMHVGTYSDEWTSIDSDILYPLPLDSMSAARLGTTDIIAFAGTLPPLIGNRAVGTEVTTEVETVQGIIVFTYKNGRWSDDTTFDLLDNVETLPGRSHVRLYKRNDLLFLSYDRNGKCAMSISSDGRHFQFPELIDDITAPVTIIPRDDYLYAVGQDTLRSPRCSITGQDPVELDITDYVTRLESSASQIRQTQYGISRPAQSDGSLALDETLVEYASSQRMRVLCRLGYWVGGNELIIDVGLEDVEQTGLMSRLPLNNSTLTASDVLSRLNRTVSDHASEYPGLEIGRDPLDDPTDTGWGGMRHLASYKPSWKADDGVLDLVSSNKEGLCVSTFVVDTLNGRAQAGFKLNSSSNDEFAGLVFRAYDKNTLFYVAYHPDESQVQLFRREGGGEDEYEDTLLDYVDSSGWGWDATSYHYLMIRTHYGRLYLYRSDDGTTWSDVSWNSTSESYTEIQGTSAATYKTWSGKFGLIGRGYSDEDYTNWRPSPWYPPRLEQPCATPDVVILWNNTQIFRTINFSEDTPDWTLEVDGLEATPGDNVISNDNRVFDLCMTADGYAYISTYSGVWKIDMKTPGNTWAQVFTKAEMRIDVGLDFDPQLRGIVQDPKDLTVIAISGASIGNAYSSAYARISPDGLVQYARCSPYKDKVVEVEEGGCSGGIDRYYWYIWLSNGGVPVGNEYSRLLIDYFVAVGGDSINTLHSLDGKVYAAGRMRVIHEGSGTTCGSAAVMSACGSPINLRGPLIESHAGYCIDMLYSERIGDIPCPGNSNNMTVSVDGDVPHFMLYESGQIRPYTNAPVHEWTDDVDSWIVRSGPSGYGGYTWCGAMIDGKTRLVDMYGNVLLAPEDYYYNGSHMGYTEGFPCNGEMMFNITNTLQYTWYNTPYTLWSEDGGNTWVEKTAKIRLSVANGGLGMNWIGNKFHGAEIYQYGSDGFS